jgi:uncharacterized membrane protein
MEQTSRRFREELRRALPAWERDGLVSPEGATVLRARYRLDAPDEDGPGLLPVYVLGALLVGAGVISLVAWHWESMPAGAKLAVIGGAMVAAHAGGFTLWRGRMPRLGHALCVLGTLVFGAGVGLVAQIFHVSGAWWAGFAAFAAGALVAGVVYPSLPTLLLGAVLALGVAGPGLAEEHPLPGVVLAWLLAVALLALAWRTRSRALAVVTALGLAATLPRGLMGARAVDWIPLALASLGAALAATPLAAAPLGARGDTGARLSGALRPVGRLGFLAVAYVLSFAELARHVRLDGRLPLEAVVAVGPALAFAVAACATGLRRLDVDPLARGEAMLLTATVAALGAGMLLPRGAGTALIANLLIAFVAAGRIVRGLASLERAPFWEGIAFAGLLGVTRFVALDVELWLKGAGFIACGAFVMAAGVTFERRRARAAEASRAG